MPLADFKIRITGNACITRYNNGERSIDTIVDSYNPAAEDKERILEYVYSKRPDIAPEPTEENPPTPPQTDAESGEKG